MLIERQWKTLSLCVGFDSSVRSAHGWAYFTRSFSRRRRTPASPTFYGAAAEFIVERYYGSQSLLKRRLAYISLWGYIFLTKHLISTSDDTRKSSVIHFWLTWSYRLMLLHFIKHNWRSYGWLTLITIKK